MIAARRGKLVNPGEGVSIWWMGDDRITFAAVSEDTGGEYAFWLDYPPAGAGPPKHVHSREEEGFLVLKGTLELKAGRLRDTVSDGAFFALPRGVPHEWRNVGDETAEIITFTARGGNEGFFLELGDPGDGPAGEPRTMPLDEINKQVAAALKAQSTDPKAIINDPVGPLWYRGLAIPNAGKDDESVGAATPKSSH